MDKNVDIFAGMPGAAKRPGEVPTAEFPRTMIDIHATTERVGLPFVHLSEVRYVSSEKLELRFREEDRFITVRVVGRGLEPVYEAILGHKLLRLEPSLADGTFDEATDGATVIRKVQIVRKNRRSKVGDSGQGLLDLAP